MTAEDITIPVAPPRSSDHPLIKQDRAGVRPVAILLGAISLALIFALDMAVSSSKKTHPYQDGFVIVIVIALALCLFFAVRIVVDRRRLLNVWRDGHYTEAVVTKCEDHGTNSPGTRSYRVYLDVLGEEMAIWRGTSGIEPGDRYPSVVKGRHVLLKVRVRRPSGNVLEYLLEGRLPRRKTGSVPEAIVERR